MYLSKWKVFVQHAVLPLTLSLWVCGTATAQSAKIFEEEPGPFPRDGECNIDDPLFDDVRSLLGPDNNIGPGSLKNLPVPEPSNLGEFVRNRRTAIQLGKALFWDMQVGSDGVQACASCHFRAGVDPRSKNQVANGGVDNQDSGFDILPNSQLIEDMFPLHLLADAGDRDSAVLRTTDDVVSSQGVTLAEFVSVDRGAQSDHGALVDDPVFNVNSINVRRVEPRNTPTMINAVFNHRNFWDGRADNIFNGVNEFGARDPNAKVLKATQGNLEFVQVRIDSASLASQAVGPPVSNFEMGFIDRPFREIGKRLVNARPLAQQKVHRRDSVLGRLASRNRNGLRTSYKRLIRAAFKPQWWRSSKIIQVNEDGTTEFIRRGPRSGPLADNQFTMMEHNFSLFFGLAIQMYEATLISDDAKIDRHFDSLAVGGPGLLSPEELEGMALFEAAACADCHSGPEFTSASVRTSVTGFENPDVSPSFQPPEQFERMFIGSCDVAVYDQGFYNIGVSPFTEDLGMGANDPFGNPLSIAMLKTMDPTSIPSQELLTLSFPSLGDTGAVPAVAQGERTAVMGSFKIPGLRNVELTAPYFHNGGQLTLRQVVEFYNRGGDFHDFISDNGLAQDDFMDLGVGNLELTEEEIDRIVDFLKTLTDERVVNQSAPFDHPELFVPNGQAGDEFNVIMNQGGAALDDILVIPAVGRFGGPLPAGFLDEY